jgi:phosphate transport system substrate-binding protein
VGGPHWERMETAATMAHTANQLLALRNRRPARATLLGACVLLAAGCGETKVITVDGSSTVFLISGAVMEKFNAVDPDIKVVVSQSGTGGGMKKFAAGEIDVCDASRAIKAEEKAACEAAKIEYIELKIAFDGLAVLVNPQNDWCDSLTVEQLKTIWRAESEESITKWSDVDPDWPDEPFKLYGPGTDSGTYDYFTEQINGEEGSGRQDYQQSENDNDLVSGVAGDKGALGYFGYAYYAANKDKLKLLGVDAGDGPVKPSPEAVLDGTYRPLSRPLYIYVRTSALDRPEVLKFLEFYLDNVGEIAPERGYVEVTDEIAKANRETFDAAVKARGQ